MMNPLAAKAITTSMILRGKSGTHGEQRFFAAAAAALEGMAEEITRLETELAKVKADLAERDRRQAIFDALDIQSVRD